MILGPLHQHVPTKESSPMLIGQQDNELAHFLRNLSTTNNLQASRLQSNRHLIVSVMESRASKQRFPSFSAECGLGCSALYPERVRPFYWLMNVKKLSREEIFSRLPAKVQVEVLHSDFCGRYISRLLSSKCPFLTLRGLQFGDRCFTLPLGSEVRIGFAFMTGWVEIEGKVVGWSADAGRSQMMLECSAFGEVFQRRGKLRFPGEMEVVCASQEAGEQSGETRNLSNSGLCVFLPQPLPKDRNLRFRILPEGFPPVEMRGEVAWQITTGSTTSACMAGVAARPVSELQRKRLQGLLAGLKGKVMSGKGAGD